MFSYIYGMSTTFVFLILPEVHLLDLAGPDQAIHEAIDYGADFNIVYCGIGQQSLSSSGLPFGKVQHYNNVKLKTGDYLIIPGCTYDYLTSTAFLKNKKLFTWIVQHYTNGVNICSICLGAFVLAESGLLNGKSCTTHFKKTKALQAHYPEINVIENILFTEENGMYTSAGIASGIDLTLHIIEQLKGSYFAHLVARELVVFNRRSGNDSQESSLLKHRHHIHTGIHKVQDYIYENIHQKLGLPDLAELAWMSERNFTRVFKKETGITVKEYMQTIRKTLAREYFKNSNLTKKEVANKVGLHSEKQLMRILKRLPEQRI